MTRSTKPDPTPPEPTTPPDPAFLLIADLAERWRVSVPEAKKIVRLEQVPFISLRTFDMNIRWSYVRFSPQAVEAWERSRERMFSTATEAVRTPTFVVGRRLRRS